MTDNPNPMVLMPCICGGIPELRHSGDGEVSWSRCTQCGDEGTAEYQPYLAVLHWNNGKRRASTAPTPATEEVARLIERVSAEAYAATGGPTPKLRELMAEYRSSPVANISNEREKIAGIIANMVSGPGHYMNDPEMREAHRQDRLAAADAILALRPSQDKLMEALQRIVAAPLIDHSNPANSAQNIARAALAAIGEGKE